MAYQSLGGETVTLFTDILDKGFYKESSDGVIMNGKNFMRKWLPSVLREEIMKELLAQCEKLRDNRIEISHIDSHHHVHTSTWAITLIPKLLKGTRINAMRNINNNYPFGISSLIRGGWTRAMQIQTRNLVIPDILSSYQRFVKMGQVRRGDVIELECHPGHPLYKEEEEMLLTTTLNDRYELITYQQLIT